MATLAPRHRSGRVRLRLVPPRRAPLTASLAARLRGPWLDRELAAGVEPWHTPAHSARSLLITSASGRRSVARSLEKLLQRAERPPGAASLTAQVPIDRTAVLGARDCLEAIVIRLRDTEPVSTRGVAALVDLLSDCSGPIYSALSRDALGRALASIRESLDVAD